MVEVKTTMDHPIAPQRVTPLVTAHSGCEGTAANSLDFLRTAIDAGADFAEVDVRLATDGVPILMHDEPQAGADLPPTVVSLESAFMFVSSGSIMLNLDLKDDECVEAVVRLVRKHNLSSRVIASGCRMDRASRVRDLGPEIPVLLNAEPPAANVSGAAYDLFVVGACKAAIEHQCCGLNLDYRSCRPALVEYARTRDLPVSVWTVDDDNDLRKMISMGVHSITTNHPRRLVELLKNSA